MTVTIIERPAIAPVPAVGWDATDDEWLYARRFGIGGSDILAILGFSTYRTPWDVWAEKKSVRSWQDKGSHAADLGTDLEPWLEQQAARILGVNVARTEHRTYQHHEYSWRMCSPDGMTEDGRLVEYKTAGLASGFGTPSGWADGAVPLGYELQVRWTLHVMNREVAEVIALIAGMGLVRRTITRDLGIEIELVSQVSEWYERHILGNVEPPLGAADNANLAKLFPQYKRGEEVDLTGNDEAIELWHAYREARNREAVARADKEAAAAALKKLIGNSEIAVIDGHPIATWSTRKGAVDWPRLVEDLVKKHRIPAPNPDEYRRPAIRTLNVKDPA